MSLGSIKHVRSVNICDYHLEGVTGVRKCDKSQGGVKVNRKVCQLMESCNCHGGGQGV